MSVEQQKVLLISPPWRTPSDGNVGVATLRMILLEAGIDTDELHGSLLFPAFSGPEYIRLLYSGFYYVPYLHPDVSKEKAVEVILENYKNDWNLYGGRLPPSEASFSALGLDEAELRRDIAADIDRAKVSIERCVERALRGNYDVVGVSCQFEPQLPAALAIVEALKARRPSIRVMIGGSSCIGDPATEILKWSPAIDAVCHTEGDQVVVPLVQALRGQRRLEEVPGIVYRGADGTPIKNPSPPQLEDLDRLPIPDYGPFIEQHAASEWRALPPKLFFETSRGCWWGEKFLCTFCGLNADGLNYRKKSSERAYREIRTLYEKYPTAVWLQATDNILDMGHLREVMPRLNDLAAAPVRPLRMFYEAKSNLKREQVRVLAKAGVSFLQPGIESFSDDMLDLMKKGTTGIRQVEIIKWMVEDGIDPIYNMLVLNPGDVVQSYKVMRALVPFLRHFPAPQVNAIWLERFSPYFEQPAEYHITNLRARAYYKWLCRTPGVDLDRLAYLFDYDHSIQRDEALIAEVRGFVAAIDEWRAKWRAGELFYFDNLDHLLVIDRRDQVMRTDRIDGVAVNVFRYLDAARPREKIYNYFTDVPRPLLDNLLATWVRRRWVAPSEKDWFVAVVPKKARGQNEIWQPALGGTAPKAEPATLRRAI